MRFMTITEQTQTAAPAAADAQAVGIERTTARARATWLAPTLVLAAVAIFGFITLLNFPVAFVDETWNANRAWDFLQTGAPSPAWTAAFTSSTTATGPTGHIWQLRFKRRLSGCSV